MKKRVMVIGVTMVMLLAGNLARSEGCAIVNPSFEDDGWIDDIAVQEPNGWSVDIPVDKFTGYIYTDWATDRTYNLTLHSEWKTFDAGDMATLSQEVDLVNVERIVFDVKLDKHSYSVPEWNPNAASALLLIDDEVVWESNSVGSDLRGEYRGQVYTVEDKYRAEGAHKLSLGIRINEGGSLYGDRYFTFWDAIDCNLFCGGGGLLEGDIDHDCCVDANDLKELAGLWLSDEIDPDDKANLFHGDDDVTSYGTINFLDFAIYAGGWDGDMVGLRELAAIWLQQVDRDDPYNLFGDDDVAPSGFINFFDFTVIADTWLGCSYVPEP